MPSFQDDLEHQVYLEAISRTAAQAATFLALSRPRAHRSEPDDDESRGARDSRIKKSSFNSHASHQLGFG
jgi:hypothetical protein